MTLILLTVDPVSRFVTWSSAGHDPALVYHPQTDTFEELETSGVPLGIDPDLDYETFSRPCAIPQTLLVIGTDGIWEARNAAGEMFGKHRLRDLIRRHRYDSAEELSSGIKSALWTWIGPRPLQDDVTFVIVKVME